MSWYKLSNHGYLQIGQNPEPGKPVFLWWWDGSFHVEKTENPNYGHREAVPNYEQIVCRGRHDPSTNITSIIGSNINKDAVNSIKSQWPNAQIKLFRI